MAVRRTVNPAKATFPDLLAEFVGETLHVVNVDFPLGEPPPLVDFVVIAAQFTGSGSNRSNEALNAVLLSLLLLLLSVGFTHAGCTSSNSDRLLSTLALYVALRW